MTRQTPATIRKPRRYDGSDVKKQQARRRKQVGHPSKRDKTLGPIRQVAEHVPQAGDRVEADALVGQFLGRRSPDVGRRRARQRSAISVLASLKTTVGIPQAFARDIARTPSPEPTSSKLLAAAGMWSHTKRSTASRYDARLAAYSR